MSLFVSFSLFNNFRLHSIHHLAITFYLLRIFNFEHQFTFGLLILFSLPSHFETMVGKFEFSNVYPVRIFNQAQIVDKRHLCQEWWTIRLDFEMTQGFWTLHYLLYLMHLCYLCINRQSSHPYWLKQYRCNQSAWPRGIAILNCTQCTL